MWACKRTYVAPLAIAIALQFEAAIPNFEIHEHHTYALKACNRDLFSKICSQRMVASRSLLRRVWDDVLIRGRARDGQDPAELELKPPESTSAALINDEGFQ